MSKNFAWPGPAGWRLRDEVDITDCIRAGDRVTILVPAGLSLRDGREYREKTGRAVMRGSGGWVLNMGGKHGTPAVASAENIVRIKSGS